jgi:phage replication-related protein YjqB (UPF0714/DUF867 family)
MNKDKYLSYAELRIHEREGKDFRIRLRRGSSHILVIAPHGGGIEPGTSEIADAVAGREHTFYAFEGLKPEKNRMLHIASTYFDEPTALHAVENARKILAIHGCKGYEEVIYVGGRDRFLKETTKKALRGAGFIIREHPHFQGEHPLNICNRSPDGMGVQLEITTGLRHSMFESLHTRRGRMRTTEMFGLLVLAIKEAASFFAVSHLTTSRLC